MSAGAAGSVYGVALHAAGVEATPVDAPATLVGQIGRAGVTVVRVGEGRPPCA